jgi:tRNA pseudouridine38-40 synthase
MRRLKLTLEYDGSGFFGWQLQARTQERTVQGVLEAAFARLPGEHSRVQAAGRTDAGVHATGMVAHIDTSSQLGTAVLTRAVNAHLPADLQVLSIHEAPPDFEAQYSCCYRYYRYRMRHLRDDT